MRPLHHRVFARTALCAAAALVAAAPALAQNTTSSFGGRVLGADGKPLAGARITALHVESGTSSQATADAEGRYALRGLRVGGPYTITFAAGELRDVRQDVYLNLAETLNLDAALGAVALERVTVTGSGSKVFDRSRNGAGTQLGRRDLDAYASIARNLQDYARLDPRISQTDKERGEISAGGQNTRYNSVTIDGVNISDTFGLESNNLPTKKQPISIDAIQSVQVNISNYDVTQKGYTGANINAVTKSGSNEFKGSIYYVYRNDDLVGDRINRTNGTFYKAPEFKDDTKGFTLGGPILKDRVFFFASFEDYYSSRSRPDFGPIGATNTNVGITQGMIDSAIAVAKNTWGMDVGTSQVPQDVALKVQDALLKLDFNISDTQRANLRYTKTNQVEPFLVGFGSNSLSLSSYWYNQTKDWESLVGQYFVDWSSNFTTEFKLSSRKYDSRPTAVNGSKLPQVTLSFSGALPSDAPAGTNANTRSLNMGTELSRHFNELRTDTVDAYFGATYNLDDHEIKFGFDRSENEVYNAFLQNTNGNYRFACENSSSTITYSFGTVNCATASADVVAQAVLENFRLGRPSSYTVQLPQAGRTLEDGVAEWSYNNTGLFAQDVWTFSKALSLQYGVRIDRQGVNDKPIYNPAAAAAFGLDNTVTLDGNTLVQPRAGFNLDLSGEGKRQLRGGVGLFQGAAANVWLSNPFSNTGMATTTYTCTNFAACRTANASFNPDPSQQPTLTGTPPAANVDFLDPGLQQPSVWKANLAFDTELPPVPGLGALTAGLEYIYTNTHRGVYYENLNLGAPTRAGADGREMFWNTAGYDPACWTTSGTNPSACRVSNRANRNASFNNVFVARPTGDGAGDTLTFSLNRPFKSNFAWGLAYTYTSAREVSPLTSSTSSSNWNSRSIFNPNEQVSRMSNYAIQDRVSGNLSWSKAFLGAARTTVGLFYEGRRGKPYSWTYLNDMNGDGVSGNDLMFIPTRPGSGEVIFKGGAAEEARFWQIVEANPDLASSKGSVLQRNASFAPWVNTFDLRIRQELGGLSAKDKASVTLDILNFGNLLNRNWGRIEEVSFPSRRGFVNYAGMQNNKYVYSLGSQDDYTTRQNAGESQWAAQVTVKYEF
jgi:hypothetical protein